MLLVNCENGNRKLFEGACVRQLFFHLYHKILLIIGKTPIGNTKWYKHTIYEEAQWVIGNRPNRKPFQKQGEK